jgi:acyl dehydratase
MTLETAPLRAERLLGASAGPHRQTIDARWLMAYAAALGEQDVRYFDTAGPGGPVAHPLFPVCYEWPLILELRARALGEAIAARSVHAIHRLTIHRAPRADDRLTSTARITEVRPRPAGALVIMAVETQDNHGAPVTTTLHGSVYRGVSVEPSSAAARAGRDAAKEDPGPSRWEAPVSVPVWLGHVYTECARIWNPIHTDVAVARAAGLPGAILHGTASLALAVSQIVARDLNAEPTRVGGIEVHFTGMVVPPSTFTVRGRARRGETITFDAVGPDGESVLGRGAVIACSK